MRLVRLLQWGLEVRKTNDHVMSLPQDRNGSELTEWPSGHGVVSLCVFFFSNKGAIQEMQQQSPTNAPGMEFRSPRSEERSHSIGEEHSLVGGSQNAEEYRDRAFSRGHPSLFFSTSASPASSQIRVFASRQPRPSTGPLIHRTC